MAKPDQVKEPRILTAPWLTRQTYLPKVRFAFALLLMSVFLSPILSSYWTRDDLFDTVWPSFWRAQSNLTGGNGSFASSAQYWTELFRDNFGRFNPLSHLTASLMQFQVSDLVVYKLIVWIATVIAVGTFAIFIGYAFRNIEIGSVFLILVLPFLQFRWGFSPFLSLQIHQQLLVFLIAVLLILALATRRAQSRRYVPILILLILVAVAGLLYYEVFAGAVLAALVLGFSRSRRAYATTISLLVILTGWAILRWHLLKVAETTFPGYKPTTTLEGATHALTNQLTSLVPASYRWISSPEVSDVLNGSRVEPWQIVVGAAASILLFQCVRAIFANGTTRVWISTSQCLSRIAIAMSVLILTCLCAITLESLNGNAVYAPFGEPYFTTMLVSLAWANLVLLAIVAVGYHIGNRVRACSVYIAAGLVGCLAVITAVSNVGVVRLTGTASIAADELPTEEEALSPYWMSDVAIVGWPRDIGSDAVRSGILRSVNVSKGENVWAFPPAPWITTSYLGELNGSGWIPVANEWYRFGGLPPVIPPFCSDSVGSVCEIPGSSWVFATHVSGPAEGWSVASQGGTITVNPTMASGSIAKVSSLDLDGLAFSRGYLYRSDRFKDCREIKGLLTNGQVEVQPLSREQLVWMSWRSPVLAKTIEFESCG